MAHIPKLEPTKVFFDEIQIMDDKFIGRKYIGHPFPFIEWNCLYDGWFLFDRGRTIRLHPDSQEEIEIFFKVFTPKK